MSTPLKWGAAREVCFAPMTDINNKNYFMVNDQAFNEGIAGLSRTVKLGDQVDMGPYSVWSMEDFTGGMMQAKYRDSQMFMWSQAGNTQKPGVLLTTWPGWRSVYNQPNNPTGEYPTHMLAGKVKGTTPNVENLWFFTNQGNIVKLSDFGATAAAVATHVGRYVTAVSDLQEDDNVATSTYFLYALDNGEVYAHNTQTGVSTLDVATPPLTTLCNGIVGYNKANYVIMNVGAAPGVPQFYKRTKTAGAVTWTKVADCTQVARLDALTVWNGRMWFCGSDDGWETTVYSSDGATVTEAFRISSFRAARLVVHYGSLYLVGNAEQPPTDVSTDVQLYGKIYKYNGASLTKLWDGRNDMVNVTAGGNAISAACSWGKNLVWTHDCLAALPGGGLRINPLQATVEQHYGVTMYDAEADAIVAGPELMASPGTANLVGLTSCVETWADTIVCGFYDPTTYVGMGRPTKPYCVAVLRTPGYGKNTNFTGYALDSFGAPPVTVLGSSAKLYSSQYVGGYPDEAKAWLSLALTYRSYDVGMTISVHAYVDGEQVASGSFTTANTNLNWVTERVQLIQTAGDYPRGTELRLEFEIIDAYTTDDINHTVEIKSATVQFVPSPVARRKWNFSIAASDGQRRLVPTGDADGESILSNTLGTEQALYDKLFSYYEAGVPVYMWGPTAGGAVTGSPVVVHITGFNRNSFRVESIDDKAASFISLELIEIV